MGESFSLQRTLCLLLAPPRITTGQSQAPQHRSHLLINTSRTSKARKSSIFSDLHFFLKATNNSKIYVTSVQTCSLKEGNGISEGAEIAAALLSLQTLYSVEK